MRHRAVPAALLAVALCWGIASTGLASAQSSSPNDHAAANASATYIDQRLAELRRLTKELEAEQAGLRNAISAAGARREALTTQLEELAVVLSQAQSRLDAADTTLSAIQSQLDTRSAELDRAESDLGGTVAKLRERAVVVYKEGPASLVEMVLGARDFSDLLRRMSYALRLAHVDNQRVSDINRERATILSSREAIQQLRDEAAGEANSVRDERNRVAGVQGALAGERAAVSGELEASYAKLGSLEQQKARYIQEQQELQVESAAISAFLRGRTDKPPTVSPKGMSWPVQGPVTSGFGWRVHPIFHTRRFHSGIDIAAPMGTPITAAASGQVIFVGEKAGYGNATIIYHGGGIATLYAHQSAFLVSSGAPVVRGQVIGRVGCTGYCTGPHVHFEVRVNGNPVDPMGWLP